MFRGGCWRSGGGAGVLSRGCWRGGVSGCSGVDDEEWGRSGCSGVDGEGEGKDQECSGVDAGGDREEGRGRVSPPSVVVLHYPAPRQQ